MILDEYYYDDVGKNTDTGISNVMVVVREETCTVTNRPLVLC